MPLRDFQDLQGAVSVLWISNYFRTGCAKHLGASWELLGTEQIASNYILANAPDAIVLPFDRYACIQPNIALGNRPFLHFFGTYRYCDGLYRKGARRFVKTLRREAGSVVSWGRGKRAGTSTVRYDA